MGFGIKKEAGSNTTPSEIVNFDKLTPTTAGVVFDPNTPATLDVLYLSSVDASTWIWNGTAYVTYTAPATATTEWYLYGTTIDAGSNKTASITRSGAIILDSDSYFRGVRIGRGNSNIATNTVVGNGAGTTNTTGTNNTFIGNGSGNLNTTASNGTFLGLNSGRNNTTAVDNTFIGKSSGLSTTTGGGNTGNGVDSLLSNTTGTSNVANGGGSLYSNTTGGGNTSNGLESLYSSTTGFFNTASGYRAGRYIADGTTALTASGNSVFLGADTKALANNQTNQVVIGFGAIGKGSNTVQIGNTSITDTYLQGAVTFNNAFTFPTTDGTANYFLKTNGSGTVTWGVAGLSYFTEAQNTTAPNATVPVDSLTAVTGTTNGDFAIIPKGSGAILAQIPDGTITGGNKRGANSVDLQTARTNALNVASGQYSVVLGYNCKASATNSIAIGATSYATGVRAIALGSNSFATGVGSVAIGNNIGATTASGVGSVALGGTNSTASGDESVAMGSGSASAANAFAMGFSSASGTNSVAMGGQSGGANGSSASGNGSFSMGLGCVADARNSASFGFYTSTKGVAQRLSLGTFSDVAPYLKGSAQLSLSPSVATTTTNTAVELVAYNGTAINLVLQDNEAIRVKGSIIGKQTASTNVSCYDFDCVIVRGVGVATTILPLSNVNLVLDTITLGTIPVLTANTTLGGLSVKSGAKTTTTIKWSCRIDSTEVILA